MSRPKLELSGTQLVASALATTTAAVAASKLGAAGTVLGAAITSVVSTAGSAIYKHYLDQSKEKVVSVIGTTTDHSADPTSIIPASPPDETRLDLRLDPADPYATRLDLHPVDPASTLPADPARTSRAEPLLVWWRRRWAVYLASAAAVFAVVMGGVAVAEQLMGNSISGVVNNEQAGSGTWGGNFNDRTSKPDPVPTTTKPTETAPTTAVPTTPRTTAPTAPAATPTPAQSSPVPTPSTTPTQPQPQAPAEEGEQGRTTTAP